MSGERMKNINKSLFAVLLIPAYLSLIIILFGAAVGSIRWGYTAFVLILFVAGAWLLSHRRQMKLNVLGFIAFFISGGYIIVSSIFKPGNQRSGFEYVEIAVGVAVMLFGIVPLLYNIVKRRKAGGQ